MLLKGKLKFTEKKRHLPDRLDEWGFELGHEEPGKELVTFQTVSFGSERGREEWTIDVEEAISVPRIGKEISEEKRTELEFELSQKIINLEALQRIVSTGCPDGGLRALAWKVEFLYKHNKPWKNLFFLDKIFHIDTKSELLLGYLPVERDAWKGELTNSRLRYAELKEELLLNPSEFWRKRDQMLSFSKKVGENDVDGPLSRHEISNGDHPLSLGSASIWHQYFKDLEIVEQIDRDLQRTHPDIKFFSGDCALGKSNQEAMRNILLLFAKLNPAIGYVQGMNEVLAPLYYVFSTDPDEKNASNVEADSFGCFVRLLSDSVDHFCQQLDNSSVGIHATLSQLSELLKANDEELWRHLEITKVNPQFYAFRWITLLLTQEFEFHSIMRIWDSLLSNPLGVQEMLLRVCCAMLLTVRRELLNGDFASNLKLLQHYPQIDIEHIIDVAQRLTPMSCSHRQSCLQPVDGSIN